jgi:peptidyl-prolyl cis-trans isomerase C
VKLLLTTLGCAAVLAAQQPVSPVAPGASASPAAPAAKVDPNTVVLTIGGHQLTAAQYEQIVKAILPPQVQAVALGPAKRAYAQKIAELFTLSAEAEKLHLDQQPTAKDQIELQRRTALSVHEFQKIQKDIPVTDAQVQSFYDANHSLYETIHARHILVRVRGSVGPAKPGKPDLTENEALQKAKAIRERLVVGEDFAKVAREESDDTSAAKGGDLGEISHGHSVPQFEAAAFALKPGEISQPVRTPYGYHIIQVESHTVKPLAEVKDDILARLRNAAAPAVVKRLVDKAGYHLDEKYFGPDPAAKKPAAPSPPGVAPVSPTHLGPAPSTGPPTPATLPIPVPPIGPVQPAAPASAAPHAAPK